MKRITPFLCIIENKFNLPVNLFANQEVKVENVAIEELLTFLQVQHTLDNIQQADPDFFGTQQVSIERIAITPDFHKGAGIPISTTIATKGFVLPQAIGKDINCGMRLYITDLNEDQIRTNLEALTKKIRHVYFQGGRNLPISPRQRKALLQYGLTGLLETWRDTSCMMLLGRKKS
jgi:tRNA-splicing ligase RtcB (3'-phosphate/5'-hydroxy nucleic acid ligase)